MSILFALFTFLIIISVGYFMRGHQTAAQHEAVQQPLPVQPAVSVMEPVALQQTPFDFPKNYAFHPGHTWVMNEGHENARIGLDAFASNLLGKVDKVEVIGLNRWVRQGQKLGTITVNGITTDFMSPIEGVITSMNHDVLRDPELLSKDPYGQGWICTVKSPEMSTGFKNLFTNGMVQAWMGESFRRLNSYAAPLGAAAADGGVPVPGLITKVAGATQREIIHEFFLS